MSAPDILFAGGGLANTLIALRVAEARPELNLLLVERDDVIGGNHTWSFHGSDLAPVHADWLGPLVQHHWQGYDVRFPDRRRTLPGSYHSITSARLNEVARSRLGESIRTGADIEAVFPDRVVLAGGEEIRAGAVIDGRGPARLDHLDVRYQKFYGQVLELAAPHGLLRPLIMDATCEQLDGYRFVYVLPFTADTLLVEDTFYSDAPGLDTGAGAAHIADYAAGRGWDVARVLRDEQGVLPITLGGDIGAFWSGEPVPRAGLRAALFHPATGYSLPQAVTMAFRIAGLAEFTAGALYAETRAASTALWQQTGFYRALNRMLFLGAAPAERRKILQRFYGLGPPLIARFYAGRSSFTDKLRILSGRPPIPLARAFDSVVRYRPGTAA